MGDRLLMSGVTEERADGHYFAIQDDQGEIVGNWEGPYESDEAAQTAFIASAESILTEMTKKVIGI